MPSYVLRTPICVLRAPAHLRARARVPGVRARPARQPFLGGPLLVPRGVAGRVGAEVQQQPGLQGRGAVLGRSDADPEPSKEAASGVDPRECPSKEEHLLHSAGFSHVLSWLIVLLEWSNSSLTCTVYAMLSHRYHVCASLFRCWGRTPSSESCAMSSPTCSRFSFWPCPMGGMGRLGSGSAPRIFRPRTPGCRPRSVAVPRILSTTPARHLHTAGRCTGGTWNGERKDRGFQMCRKSTRD